MRRRRLRKWAKWTCTGASGTTIALLVLSRFFACGAHFVPEGTRRVPGVGIGGGLVSAWTEYEWTPGLTMPPPGWHFGRASRWRWGTAGEKWPAAAMYHWSAGFCWSKDPLGWTAGVTLVYPVLLTSIPAAFL